MPETAGEIETIEQESFKTVNSTLIHVGTDQSLRSIEDIARSNLSIAKDTVSLLNEAIPIPGELHDAQIEYNTVVDDLQRNRRELGKSREIFEKEGRKPFKFLSMKRLKMKKQIPALEEVVSVEEEKANALYQITSSMKRDLKESHETRESKAYKQVEQAVESVLNNYSAFNDYLNDNRGFLSFRETKEILKEETTFSSDSKMYAYKRICGILIRDEKEKVLERFLTEIEQGEYLPEQKEKIKGIIHAKVMDPRNPLNSEPYIRQWLLDSANKGFLEIWDRLRDNEKFRDVFGKERLFDFEEKVKEIALDELLKTEPTGRKIDTLMKFRTPENIPYTIMGIWRFKRNNDRPYVHVLSEGQDTIAYKFISSLTESELRDLEKKEIPGLMEIIKTVKEDPGFFHRHKIRKESGEIENNPSYQIIKENFNKLSLHYFQNEDESIQSSAWDLLKDSSDLNLHPIADILEEHFVSSNDKKRKGEILELVFSNMHFTENLEQLPPKIRESIQEYEKLKGLWPHYEYEHGFSERSSSLKEAFCLALTNSVIESDLTDVSNLKVFLKETIAKEDDLMARQEAIKALVRLRLFDYSDFEFLKKNVIEIRENLEKEDEGSSSNLETVDEMVLKMITYLEPNLDISQVSPDVRDIVLEYRNFKRICPSFDFEGVSKLEGDGDSLRRTLLRHLLNNANNNLEVELDDLRVLLKDVVENDADLKTKSMALEVLVSTGGLDYEFLKASLEKENYERRWKIELYDKFLKNLDKFENHVEIAKWLINDGFLLKVLENAGKFNKLPREVDVAYEILGDFLDLEGFEIISKLLGGEISEEIKDLVSKGGQHGVEQLRDFFNSFKKEIISNEFNPQILLENSFIGKYYKSYIRFEKDSGTWGNRNDGQFRKIIQKYQELKTENASILKLDSEFSVSEIIPVLKTDQKKREGFQFPEDFLQVYGKFNSSLREAFNMLNEKKPFSILVESMNSKRDTLLEELKQKLEEYDNVKAIENLKKQIELLSNLNLRSVSEFQENFSLLSNYSEFQEELRQVVFLIALKKRKNIRDDVENHLSDNSINPTKVSWMLDFVEHIVNQETVSKYFKNKKEAKAFQRIVNVEAISEVMSKINESDDVSDDVLNLKFVPSRDLLLEFSGYIGDACWASSYDNIAKAFPNITALTFVRHPGTKHESMAGACLLIKTKSKDDEPLLVIRGLNPIENVINSISTKDFFEKLFEYLKDVAQKDGRKLAIVIASSEGKSGTNRKAIHDYSAENFADEEKRVVLKSDDDTKFNNYSILNKCYLV